jgi:hypothetical protein
MRDVRLSREQIALTPWGAPYLRELDLMMAANELASFETGRCLYNRDFDEACAHRVMPLDGALELKRLADVRIPKSEDPHRQYVVTEETIRTTLRDAPRGYWAVFYDGQGYDAYISNGIGGVDTESGHKFQYRSANAPPFNDAALYATIISMITYLRRNQIRNAIIAESVKAAGIKPGTIATDKRLGSHTYSRVVFDGVEVGYYSGSGDAYRVTGHRRGVKPKSYIVTDAALSTLYDVAMVMPAQFDDAGNADRVIDIVKPRIETLPQTAMSGPGPSIAITSIG